MPPLSPDNQEEGDGLRILQRPHLKANYVTMARKGCPNLKAPPNAPHKCGILFPLFGGCTATVLALLAFVDHKGRVLSKVADPELGHNTCPCGGRGITLPAPLDHLHTGSKPLTCNPSSNRLCSIPTPVLHSSPIRLLITLHSISHPGSCVFLEFFLSLL